MILFNTLQQSTEDKPLTVSQKRSFVTKAKDLDIEGAKTLAMLIYRYVNDSKESFTSTDLPYNGSYNDQNDIVYDIEMFPPHLQQILYKFLLSYVRKLTNKQKNDTAISEAKSITKNKN